MFMFTLFSSTYFDWKKSYISNCEYKWSWANQNCRFQNDRQKTRDKTENVMAAWLRAADYFVNSMEKKSSFPAYHLQSLTFWIVSCRFYSQYRFAISTLYCFSVHSEKKSRGFLIFLCHSIKISNSMNVFVSPFLHLFIRYFFMMRFEWQLWLHWNRNKNKMDYSPLWILITIKVNNRAVSKLENTKCSFERDLYWVIIIHFA